MAIVFEATYSKKLGLPGYSSHQYSVTIRTELGDLNQVDEQSEHIHGILQSAVDREIQKNGYLPQGHQEPGANAVQQSGSSVVSSPNGNGFRPRTNGYRNPRNNGHFEQWCCSPKQQELILKIVQEHRLDKRYVDQVSHQLFSVGVRQLNRLQASGLIDELLRRSSDSNPPAMTGGRR